MDSGPERLYPTERRSQKIVWEVHPVGRTPVDEVGVASQLIRNDRTGPPEINEVPRREHHVRLGVSGDMPAIRAAVILAVAGILLYPGAAIAAVINVVAVLLLQTSPEIWTLPKETRVVPVLLKRQGLLHFHGVHQVTAQTRARRACANDPVPDHSVRADVLLTGGERAPAVERVWREPDVVTHDVAENPHVASATDPANGLEFARRAVWVAPVVSPVDGIDDGLAVPIDHRVGIHL